MPLNSTALRGLLTELSCLKCYPARDPVHVQNTEVQSLNRAKALTQITPGLRIGSNHYFLARIRAPNIILAGGSRIRGSDLIPNTLTLSAVIRTLRVSYAVTKLLVVSKHS